MKKLIKRRVIDMTEDELVELLTRTKQRQEPENVTGTTKDVQKKLLRGYKELAAFLHCHVSTAYRKVACGDLHAPAVIRSGKMVLFDPELVIEQLLELDSKWVKVSNKTK